MPESDHAQLATLVRETRQYLQRLQAQFVTRLGVSFQSANCWENRRTKPLPIASPQLKYLLHQMGEVGQDVRANHFSE